MIDLVTVIMSTFNEKVEEVESAVSSILNQTYKHFELIIVLDNPDNEKIITVIENYARSNSKIKIIYNQKNLGLAQSLNKAIRLAKGKYIARMDADDISFPNRIDKEVKYLKKYNLDMVATNRIDINEKGEQLNIKSKLPKTKSVNKILPIGNFITHPTILIKADVIKDVKGYRDFRSSQDYDLWLRIITEGYKIGILDEPLLYYRVRANSISKSNKYKQYLYNRYQKSLYIKRKEKGIDDFTKDNLNFFLGKFKYFDVNYRERFNKAFVKLDKGIIKIKKKKFFIGSILIFSAIISHKEIANCFKDNLRYQIIRRKYL